MNNIRTTNEKLDTIHHVALSVEAIGPAVVWYRVHFHCTIEYQDETWALLQFANMRLALVLPDQHPPHLGIFNPNATQFGPLKTHRDGTRSVYVDDPSGNKVEILEG